MQNIATGKSEIAALPLMKSTESSNIIRDPSAFESYFKDASEKSAEQPFEPKIPETNTSDKATRKLSEDKKADDGDINKVNPDDSPKTGQQNTAPSTPKTLESQGKENKNTNDIELAKTKLGESEEEYLADTTNTALPVVDWLTLLEQSKDKKLAISTEQQDGLDKLPKNLQELMQKLQLFLDKQENRAGDKSPSLIDALNALTSVRDGSVKPSESNEKISAFLHELSVLLGDQNIDEKSELDLQLLVGLLEEGAESEKANQVNNLNDLTPGLPSKSEIEKPQVDLNIAAKTVDSDAMHEHLAKSEDGAELATSEFIASEVNAAEVIATEVKKSVLLANETIIDSGEMTTNKEVGSTSKELAQLLQLSPEKLEKALQNLADRLIQEKASTELAEKSLTNDFKSIKVDFIASLKANLDDIKSQSNSVKSGAADLKSMVTDILSKTSLEVNLDSVSAAVSRFSQTLDVSTQMGSQTQAVSSNLLESLNVSSQSDRAISKEMQIQSNVLQTKQAQQQNLVFEKAVNIARSEGHNQLVEKVRWMVNQNNLQADIRLDPPDLGAMKVRVSLSGESASVNIVVQSQQAKDLLDNAAPRLKDLLEEQGIALGQSSVEQEQKHGSTDKDNQIASKKGSTVSEDEVQQDTLITEQTIRNGRLNGIDYFV